MSLAGRRFGPVSRSDRRRLVSRYVEAFAIATAIYLGAAVVGVAIASEASATSPPMTWDGDGLSFVVVLRTNVHVALALAFGGGLLGVPTAIGLVLNGIGFGAVAASIVRTAGGTIAIVVLLPHAVFELPALWLAGAAGLRIPIGIVRYLRGTEAPDVRTEALGFVVTTSVAIGLVVLGAVVETIVTPWLVAAVR